MVFWGYLNEQAEIKLRNLGKLAPEDWGNNAKTDPVKGLVPTEGGQLWLVEIVAPFHTDENQHQEQIFSDLIQTTFKGKAFKFMKLNPTSRKREEVCIGVEGKRL